MIRDPFPAPEDIGVASDQLAFIVLKARAYDAEVEGLPDEGSNEADDRSIEALESSPDNTNARELRGAIAALDEDAQCALVAMVWLARGDFEPAEWTEAQAAARERKGEGSTARYLLGIPQLGDLIEDGADKLGISLTSEEQLGMHHPAIEEPSEDDRS